MMDVQQNLSKTQGITNERIEKNEVGPRTGLQPTHSISFPSVSKQPSAKLACSLKNVNAPSSHPVGVSVNADSLCRHEHPRPSSQAPLHPAVPPRTPAPWP